MISSCGSNASLPQVLFPVSNTYSVDRQQTAKIGTLTSIINVPQTTEPAQTFNYQGSSSCSYLDPLLQVSQDNLRKRKLKHLEFPTPKEESSSSSKEALLSNLEQDFEETLMSGQVITHENVKENTASTSKPSSSKKRKKAKELEPLDLSDNLQEIKMIQELCRAASEKIEASHLNNKSKKCLIKNFKIAQAALEANAVLVVDPSAQLPTQRRRIKISNDKTGSVAKQCFFCETKQSSQWRRIHAEDASYVACNPCGLFYKRKPNLVVEFLAKKK